MEVKRFRCWILFILLILLSSFASANVGEGKLGAHRPCFVMTLDDDKGDCGDDGDMAQVVVSAEYNVNSQEMDAGGTSKSGFVKVYNEGDPDRELRDEPWDTGGDCDDWADADGDGVTWKCLPKENDYGCLIFVREDDTGEGSGDECLVVHAELGKTLGHSGDTWRVMGYSLYEDEENERWWSNQDYADDNAFCAFSILNNADNGWFYNAPGGEFLCLMNEWMRCDEDSEGRIYATKPVHEDVGTTTSLYKCLEGGEWKYVGYGYDGDHDGYLEGHWSSQDAYDEDGMVKWIIHTPYNVKGDMPFWGTHSGNNNLVRRHQDCDDSDDEVYPSDVREEDDIESCNDEKDNDCDGKTDMEENSCGDFYDFDGDGFTISEGDCSETGSENRIGGGMHQYYWDHYSYASGYCEEGWCADKPYVMDYWGGCPDDPADCTIDSAYCNICIFPMPVNPNSDDDIDATWEYCDGIDNDCDDVVDEYCEADVPDSYGLHSVSDKCQDYSSYGRIIGVEPYVKCCGDDLFFNKNGYYARASTGGYANHYFYEDSDEYPFIGETFTNGALGGCFNNFPYWPGYSGMSPKGYFDEKMLFSDSLTGTTFSKSLGGVDIAPESLYRHMIINVFINSDTDTTLTLEGSWIRGYELLSSSPDNIWTKTIPSTDGKTIFIEETIIIPNGDDSWEYFAAMSDVSYESYYVVNLTVSRTEGVEHIDEYVYVTSLLRHVNNRKAAYFDDEFYGCRGIEEYSRFPAIQVKNRDGDDVTLSNLPRDVWHTVDTGYFTGEYDVSVPPYPWPDKALAIPEDNIVDSIDGGVCGRSWNFGSNPENNISICQVTGWWENDLWTKNVGTNLKPVPESLYSGEPADYFTPAGNLRLPLKDIVDTFPMWRHYSIRFFSPEQLSELVDFQSGVYSHGCCGENSCWNGISCVDSMSHPIQVGTDPQLIYDDNYYMCIAGEWQKLVYKKDQYYFLEGLCPESMCLLNAGDPEFTGSPSPPDPYNIFYPSGFSWYDHTCVGGTWVTRTNLLAGHLLNILPDNFGNDNFELECNNAYYALNDVYYTAMTPPHYVVNQSGPPELPEGEKAVFSGTAGLNPPYTLGYLFTSGANVMDVLNTLHLPEGITDVLDQFFLISQFGEMWPMVNNFCILTYYDETEEEDKVLMGVSLNNPSWSFQGGILRLINNSDKEVDGFTYLDYCEGAGLQALADIEDGLGEKYYGCAGSNFIAPGTDSTKVWYNPTRESLIYSPDEIILPDDDDVGGMWTAGYLKEMITWPILISLPNFENELSDVAEASLWDLEKNGNNANHIYISRSGDKEIVSVFDPIEQFYGGIMSVVYSGFDMSADNNLCHNPNDWWGNFKDMVDKVSDSDCGSCSDPTATSAQCKRCVCNYYPENDTLVISTYGPYMHGSFLFGSDMTSKLRYESEGEGGIWAWMNKYIIDNIMALIDAMIAVLSSTTEAIIEAIQGIFM